MSSSLDMDISLFSMVTGRGDLLPDSSRSPSESPSRTSGMDTGAEEADFKRLVKWIRDVNNVKSPPIFGVGFSFGSTEEGCLGSVWCGSRLFFLWGRITGMWT